MCVSSGRLALLWDGEGVIDTFCGKAVASLGGGFLPAFRALLIIVCGLVGWSGPAQAQVIQLPECDAGLYLTQTEQQNVPPTQLIRFDTSTNPIQYDVFGVADEEVYNAVAFNPWDRFLYAIRRGTNILIRIGSDGSTEELGSVGGLPEGDGAVGFPAGYISGEIDPAGYYYVRPGSINDHLYKIDLGGLTATLIETSLEFVSADMAWHDGRLYAVGTEELPDTAPDRDQLYEIDPESGQVNRIGAGTPAVYFPAHFGAMFGATNGVFGVNNDGGFYQFDTVTGVATLISDVQGSDTNDGAKCVTTAVRFPADLAISKDDGSDIYVAGEDVVYTIVVSNSGPFGSSGAVVNDPLPAGITTARWTCGSGAGGGSCSVASGDGAIEDVSVSLPVGASVTFTLTLSVPDDYTGELVNVATVDPPSGDSPDDDLANNTATDIDVTTTILVNKTASPASGTAVSVGDTLSYTLSVGVANAATNEPVELTDTLDAGLDLGPLPAGCGISGQEITCTLAAGADIGTHTFEYTATVNEDATTQVGNSVETSTGICGTCSTSHPVDPTILVNKTANPGSGSAVSVGDPLTYTLSVDVTNAATNEPVVLTDTLGAGLDLGTLPTGCSAEGQEITCTLAAGANIGAHTFEYTATVNEDATTQVGNSVETSTGDCGTCSTSHPVDPTILVNKTANPASGSAVSVGDPLTYTLSVDVTNAVTGEDVVLTDTLGAGLDLGTLPTGCLAEGQEITCTLAAGANIGAHTFEYTATVNEDATTQVGNSVETSTGDCGTCSTTHPVDPTILVGKAANPASGTAVSVGDTLTYTLSVDVANAVTNELVVLTDTLGAGLNLGPLPNGCGVVGREITCTLAAGANIGTHTFEYTATVNEDATTQVGNSVETSTGICGTCSTSHPVDPTILVGKTANPASGTAVSVGDTLTYTLSVEVANAVTDEPVVLTDTLDAGLDLGPLPNGCGVVGQEITCTLAAGAAIGTHTFEYTATVNEDATTQVGNSVETSTGICGTCSTSHPVDPTILVGKTANPASGTAVSVGDTLTYTLSVEVANAVTDEPVVLTDTLGEGLTLDPGSLPAGCSAPGQVITCTLAAGADIGSYTFAYNTTVNEDATTEVGNSVETSTGICGTCSTSHPVDPTILVGKTASPGSGSAVSVGDTLSYTLSVDVANAATNEPVVLTDTLDAGLDLGPLPNGCGVVGQVITCTLAAGADIGAHTFEYTATVNEDATTQVGNSVETSTGICGTCSTTHPVDPMILVSKTASPASGSAVSVGDPLTYTLRVDVANTVTDEVVELTDTLGAGLTLGTLPTGCSAEGQEITCTLAAGANIGAHTFEYTATVNEDATTQVGNSVETSTGICGTCTTTHPVDPTILVGKAANPASGTAVSVGDTLTYTLSVDVANAVTNELVVLTDTLGAGLDLGPLPNGCGVVGQEITCTLAAGADIGAHTFEYTATVNEDATTQVGNSVETSTGDCGTCSTTHPVDPTILVGKAANPASGTAVSVGDTLTYTLSVDVANAVTNELVVLTDTLDAGLDLGPLPNGCGVVGREITCTLAAGANIGTHTFEYTATVNEDATTQVGNSVETSTGICGTCSTSHPVDPTILVNKTANPASGTAVSVGDTLTYTLSVEVANAVTDEPVVLTDTLGAGLDLGPLPNGCGVVGREITCTLAAGAAIGTQTFEYTATVNEDATTQAGNSVETSTGICGTCSTSHPVDPTILVGKTANPGSGTPVSVGDTLTYTLSVDVTNAVTGEDVVLTDTLGAGLDLGALPAGCGEAGQEITCTLAAGAAIGTHTFEYTATVNEDATIDVENRVTTDDGVCEPGTCTTTNPVLPRVQVSKTADPEDGTEVAVGDILTYTLSATVSNGATIEALTLSDTPGGGQTLLAGSITVPSGGSCDVVASSLECTLAAGTPPGVYLFSYQTRVDPDAGDAISNNVVASGGGGGDGPDCTVCSTGHPVANQMQLRLTKSAGVRSARIGDLVRYVLTVENVGIAPVTDAVVVDTPPPGFNYVENSMSVDDGDDAFELSPGRYPLRIGGIDLTVGEQGTIAYVLRIGAGARHGNQINSVVAQNAADEPISNVATAQVNVETGPLLDDSLIFGTVFDDRDADGWRDSAALTGIWVQGGFEPSAYIPPMAGASAPLLQGIALGDIAARQSEGDPIEAHRLVIRQHLTEPAFTDDFVLTSDQGVTVRMDATGNTRVEKSGDAARGLNAAEPIVKRRLFQEKDGLVVDYVISNAGIDERGLPGVRLASAEGVLIETDQYGRFHMVDVQGGARGYSNFILKVDPSTLPPGTPFTTENPHIRRITPGVPVRFDFGVQLPVELMPGGTEEVELVLGEVIFAPGSAEVRAEYRPAIARMAEQVDAYGGGEVVITADGTRQALAFERAIAVRDLLLEQIAPEHAQALRISVRTEVNELVSGTTAGGLLLGTVLFDTDRSEIRPEFEAVIERVAVYLEEMGSGVVAVVGHTDVRASYEHNVALGLRRARAVYEALAARLSPEVRARVRVESSNDPKAPVASAYK